MIELLAYVLGEVLDGRNSDTTDGVQRALGREAARLRRFRARGGGERRLGSRAGDGVIDLPIALTSFEASLFVHITAAILGLGATFVESFTYPVAMRLDPRHLPYKHALQLTINAFVALPALVVLFVTGIYQASKAGYDLDEPWLGGTLTIVIVLALMIVAYFIPEDRRLRAMAERDIAASGSGDVAVSRAYERRVRLEGALGAVAGGLVVVAVFLMVTKPGL